MAKLVSNSNLTMLHDTETYRPWDLQTNKHHWGALGPQLHPFQYGIKRTGWPKTLTCPEDHVPSNSTADSDQRKPRPGRGKPAASHEKKHHLVVCWGKLRTAAWLKNYWHLHRLPVKFFPATIPYLPYPWFLQQCYRPMWEANGS